MFNLIRNENMKIYSRPRTWVFIGLVVLLVLFNAVMTYASHNRQQATDWRHGLTVETADMKARLADPQKRAALPDVGIKTTEARIQLNEYDLDHNIAPNRVNAWSFAKDSATQTMVLAILAIVVAGEIVSSEFNWGTIKMLLIRPVSRTKIYLSKYLASLLFGLVLLAVLFASSVVIGGLLFGFDGISDPYVHLKGTEVVTATTMGAMLWATYGLKVVYLVVVATIAFMISSAFRSSVGAIAITMIVVAVGEVLANLMTRFPAMKYFLFTNTDLTHYLEGSPLIAGMSAGFSVNVVIAYLLVFHSVGWLVFTKRDVAA